MHSFATLKNAFWHRTRKTSQSQFSNQHGHHDVRSVLSVSAYNKKIVVQSVQLDYSSELRSGVGKLFFSFSSHHGRHDAGRHLREAFNFFVCANRLQVPPSAHPEGGRSLVREHSPPRLRTQLPTPETQGEQSKYTSTSSQSRTRRWRRQGRKRRKTADLLRIRPDQRGWQPALSAQKG